MASLKSETLHPPVPPPLPNPPPPPPCTHEPDFALFNQAILDIKDNLTYLRDLMTSNAVLEEQVSTLNREMKTVKRDIGEVKMEQAKASGSSAWMEKICWGLVSLALGALIGMVVR